ncbi:MAG: hypothetical protein CBARDCOR_3613 [uncultured Caballeronia sp.]|nr:MAG: hypothetical protein CBARDCOR_3613 [uncultured Caballeronia sp.]
MSKLSAPELNVVHQQEAGHERPFDMAINHQIDQLIALRRRTDRQAIRNIAKAIASAKRRIIIGSGSFAAITSILSHHATLCGYRSELATDGVSIANALGDLTNEDVVVVITFWRLCNSAIKAAYQSRSKGAVTCVIMDAAVEPLARNADHLLLAPAESTSFYATALPGISFLVEGISAELAALDPQATANSTSAFEEQWQNQNLLFY